MTACSSWLTYFEKQGRLADAEQLYRRRLDILQKHFGWQHIDVARALRSVAFILGAQKNTMKREALHRQDLRIQEQLFGPESEKLVPGLRNLAHVLDVQRKFAEAEQLYRRALAIHRSQVGIDRETLTLLERLDRVLDEQGRSVDAKTVRAEVQEINATLECRKLRSISRDERTFAGEDPFCLASRYHFWPSVTLVMGTIVRQSGTCAWRLRLVRRCPSSWSAKHGRCGTRVGC